MESAPFHIQTDASKLKSVIYHFRRWTYDQNEGVYPQSLAIIRAMIIMPQFLTACDVSMQTWRLGAEFAVKFGGSFPDYRTMIRQFKRGLDQVIVLLQSRDEWERAVMEKIVAKCFKFPGADLVEEDKFPAAAMAELQQKRDEIMDLLREVEETKQAVERMRVADRAALRIFYAGVLPHKALDIVERPFHSPLEDLWQSLGDLWLIGADPADVEQHRWAYETMVSHTGIHRMFLWTQSPGPN